MPHNYNETHSTPCLTCVLYNYAHVHMLQKITAPPHTVDPPTPALPFTAHQTGGVSLLCEDGRLSACHAPAASLSADNWPTGALRLYESPVENLTYTVKSVGSRLFCRGGGGAEEQRCAGGEAVCERQRMSDRITPNHAYYLHVYAYQHATGSEHALVLKINSQNNSTYSCLVYPNRYLPMFQQSRNMGKRFPVAYQCISHCCPDNQTHGNIPFHRTI